MRIGFAAWTVGVVLALAAAVPAGATDSDAYRVARGFKIAPVPLNLRGLDRNEVGLGSYLVNAAGGCNEVRHDRRRVRRHSWLHHRRSSLRGRSGSIRAGQNKDRRHETSGRGQQWNQPRSPGKRRNGINRSGRSFSLNLLRRPPSNTLRSLRFCYCAAESLISLRGGLE